jgi:hypothetical protein
MEKKNSIALKELAFKVQINNISCWLGAWQLITKSLLLVKLIGVKK